MSVDTKLQMPKSHVKIADVQGRTFVLLRVFLRLPSEACLTLQQHNTRLLRSVCCWELSADTDANHCPADDSCAPAAFAD